MLSGANFRSFYREYDISTQIEQLPNGSLYKEPMMKFLSKRLDLGLRWDIALLFTVLGGLMAAIPTVLNPPATDAKVDFCKIG